MKMFFFIFVIFTLVANVEATNLKKDIYKLTYSSKTKECSATLNGKSIKTFDPAFKNVLAPKNGYTCNLIRKKHYSECTIGEKKNLTALFFGYGQYDKTNLVVAFKNPMPSFDASIEVICK